MYFWKPEEERSFRREYSAMSNIAKRGRKMRTENDHWICQI